MSAVGDARKRQAEQHHTHPDPAVRELIARAEARGAERALRVVEALAEEWEREYGEASKVWRVFGPQKVSIPFVVYTLRALLAEHPDKAIR